MVSLSSAMRIPGWMSQAELEWLRSMALSMPPGAKAYELGSWMGRSTAALCVDGLDLTCVDTWQGAPNDLTQSLARQQQIFQIFKKHMRGLRLSPKIIKMDVIEAAAIVPDASADLVFDDSDHDVYFERNFWAWIKKVKPGGVYCGHDFNRREFPAIPRVLESSGLRFTVIPGTTIWAMRRGQNG